MDKKALKECASIEIWDFWDVKHSKTFQKAIENLNDRKAEILEKIATQEYHVFDYPDYWGLPKAISSKLSSEEVDFIQYQTEGWHSYIERNYTYEFYDDKGVRLPTKEEIFDEIESCVNIPGIDLSVFRSAFESDEFLKAMHRLYGYEVGE